MHGFLSIALVFLAAAVIVVPISQRLGFGPVLGYLAAGILIGPSGLRLITNVEDIMHFSEFGVVLLLFLIGLELEPKVLWERRVRIFGLGAAQVLGCIAFAFCVSLALGSSWQVALLSGMGFSLSSTAMVLQFLNERKILKSDGGKSAFAILLFQDMAVIPMIAILPLLIGGSGGAPTSSFITVLKVVGILALVWVAGRLFLRAILRRIASLHLRDVFTAFSLLVVVSMAYLMQYLEISMALGAFMAGLLLADSEYKHALEADIEPFKGLLLGLFFISVGMSVRLDEVMAAPALIASLVMGVFLLKLAVHLGLGWLFKINARELPFFALLLAQVGEFAFVLFDSALRLGILTPEQRQVLTATAALSILATPIMVKLYDWILAPHFEKCDEREEDQVEKDGAPVIIAGFGRVGQIVGRYLFANGIKATVLDFEPGQVDSLRRFGFKVFYGDATRYELLEAAGAREAEILVVAIDDMESNLKLVDMARERFPHLKIVCRSRNVDHFYELKDRGVLIQERETFDGALRLGRHVMEALGSSPHQAFTLAQKFRAFDHRLLEELGRDRGNAKGRISKAKQARKDIERLFAEEDSRRRHGDEGWGAEPSEGIAIDAADSNAT
jgi:glutathione-regulated potassium-efflux system ancillary protein KefC